MSTELETMGMTQEQGLELAAGELHLLTPALGVEITSTQDGGSQRTRLQYRLPTRIKPSLRCPNAQQRGARFLPILWRRISERGSWKWEILEASSPKDSSVIH